MLTELTLQQPFPSRGAATALRRQIMQHLRSCRPRVGEPFLTDADLVKLSNLSRSTIRRALDELQREGWIDRRVGQGTFIGPRAVAFPAEETRPPESEAKRVVRAAIIIFNLGDLTQDWYTPPVLQGIDDAAEEFGISVELLGNRDRDVDAISRRLSSYPPDLLICLADEPRHAFVIRDAQRLGIPCLVTGTPHAELGVPAVCEDNRQGMTLAVEHLVALGHQRIGLAIQGKVERWVFDRHEAYLDALAMAGIEADESLVHWIPIGVQEQRSAAALATMASYLRRHRPTAVIAADYLPFMLLDRLARQQQVKVPQELSVVSFEPYLETGVWLGGVQPTFAKLPLRQMGRELARLARLMVEKQPASGQIYLPFELIQGESTARPQA